MAKIAVPAAFRSHPNRDRQEAIRAEAVRANGNGPPIMRSAPMAIRRACRPGGLPGAMLAALLAVILVVLAGCGAAPAGPDTHDADIRTIKESEALWLRGWSTRDVEGILAHYAEDAIWMAPHMPIANGREAIRQVVKRLVQDANFSVSFEASRVDTAKSGDFGYSQGTYTMTLTDPVSKKAVTGEGSYVRIYRRALDGGWRTIQEINTGDQHE